ncbi:hypothetical protein L195_g059265, partial [Trifolium pratense]
MDAIEWIERMGERKVIFELDSQIVVNAVKDKNVIRKSWGCIIRRCKTFLQHNPNSTIEWVPREAIQAAHEMAKWAESEPNKEWTDNIPP